ncbi:MAG: TerC family protein [Stackebrandtia sp.]
MDIPTWVWTLTLVGVVAVVTVDLLVIGRRPHRPSIKESSLWVSFYIGAAAVFGLGLWMSAGATYSGEFFAGYITEYSLSIDNLFVFLLIMSRFAVPHEYQQKVLMFGIILALVLRGLFIAAGAVLISQFVWMFFIFGAFLLYTAIQLARTANQEEELKENACIRWARKVLPMSKEYNGGTITVKEGGKRLVTPMLIVLIAIGTTDVLFALDSIPAIFGLTQEGYLVFTANVFALMGLRQLYFLIGGLLDKLVYLSYGLSVLLGYIGVKLVFHALHENHLPFVNGGRPVAWVPEIPTAVSLTVIVAILTVATVASLIKTSRDEAAKVAAAAADGEPVAEPKPEVVVVGGGPGRAAPARVMK